MKKIKNLTIFIPVYNRKEYIEQALKSAVIQDYPYKKIVVIDDGSTDGTFGILKKLRKRWDFDLLRTPKPRRGTYWISNMVMKKYKSDFYQVIDSDDILLPYAASKMIKFMIKENAYAVGGQYIYINENARPIKRYHWRPYNANDAYKIERDQHISRSGMVWQRDIIKKIGYFNDSTICTSDLEFTLKALEKGLKIRSVPFPVMKFRFHSNSLSKSRFFGKVNKEREENLKRIFKKYPYYFNVDYKYLDFFEKEMKKFDLDNIGFQIKFLSYIEKILLENKNEKPARIKKLVNKLPGKLFLKGYVLALINTQNRNISNVRKFIKELKNIPDEYAVKIYRLASFCQKNKYSAEAESIFEKLKRKRKLPVSLKKGAAFHLSQIKKIKEGAA